MPETVSGLAGFSGSSGGAATHETLVAPAGLPRSGEFPFLAPPQHPDELGRLGPFRVLGLIGAGGMGAVFRAEDPALRRHVALKVMLPQFAGHPTARARFLREARSQAAVEHTHIVAIHQVGEEGVPFITMPLLKGESLADALAAGPTFPVGEAVRVAREIAEGLAAAHAAGLVHRDVKPANVWLEGPSRHVKVLDFGLARAGADGDPADAVTAPGAIIGTPAYMSPEQATGEPVDARSDLFSLGVVLYQMLTGRQPFTGKNTPATLTAVATHTPTDPAERNRAVPPPLSALTMRLLAKAPADRPASAGAVAEALRAIAAGATPPAARAEPTVPEPRQSESGEPAAVPRKPGRGFLVGAGIALAVLAVLVVVANRNRDGTESPATAPDGSPVTAAPPGRAEAPAPGPDPVKEVAPPFDDRLGAEWAIKLGGAVRFDDGDTDTKNPADLPKGAFRLTGLSLVGERVTDVDLARFNGCKNLTRLDLPHSTITDTGLANFKWCGNLTHLDLTASQVTDAGLACFDGYRTLTQLTLDETKITGAGLVHFKNCAGLRGLGLGGCSRLTDAGLEHLKGLKFLTALDLNSTQVTDAGLAYFKECIDLKELNLARTGVTATGLAVFKDFKRLSIVYLDRTPTTDAGLAHLMDGDSLSSIFLRATKVTRTGVAAFAKAQPGCRVEWEGGVIEPK
ncbi:protein kinase domain-containing protein [Gemmata sp.]|uniref:protein kinase domain-containing protein n=1 Tax=Gemmata sp. TaxID=1914242 RepID=UPI003F7107AC